MLCLVVVTVKILGTPCMMERMKRRKLGETFKDGVSDDPNALVKPKIWGTEALEVRGQLKPLWKILREARLCQDLF